MLAALDSVFQGLLRCNRRQLSAEVQEVCLWLRKHGTPALAEELRVELDAIFEPVLATFMRQGVHAAMVGARDRGRPLALENVILGQAMSIGMFDGSRYPPPLNLVRLCALFKLELASEPRLAGTYCTVATVGLKALIEAKQAPDLADEPLMLAVAVDGYADQVDQLALDIDSVDAHGSYLNRVAVSALGHLAQNQPAFLARFVLTPNFGAIVTVLRQLVRSTHHVDAVTLANVVVKALTWATDEHLLRLLDLGAIEYVARAYTSSLTAMVEEQLGARRTTRQR